MVLSHNRPRRSLVRGCDRFPHRAPTGTGSASPRSCEFADRPPARPFPACRYRAQRDRGCCDRTGATPPCRQLRSKSPCRFSRTRSGRRHGYGGRRRRRELSAPCSSALPADRRGRRIYGVVSEILLEAPRPETPVAPIFCGHEGFAGVSVALKLRRPRRSKFFAATLDGRQGLRAEASKVAPIERLSFPAHF